MTFKTAAFKVLCSQEYRELFYDELLWPAGCELRDWYTKKSNNAAMVTDLHQSG